MARFLLSKAFEIALEKLHLIFTGSIFFLNENESRTDKFLSLERLGSSDGK